MTSSQQVPQTDKLAAALGYAARGWLVFPCHSPRAGGFCSCNDPTCDRQGKHPRTPHGLLDATTDKLTIENWWRTWPDANIAIRTGEESGIVAFDFDGPEGDQFAVASGLPGTMVQKTGSGGWHHVFAWPGRKVVSRQRVRPGVDIRGDGGYIIVAPSMHWCGAAYEWHTFGDILPIPPVLERLLVTPEPINAPADDTPAPADVVARASAYLAKIPGAISGQSGHDQTWSVALSIVNGFCLSRNQAFWLIYREYNPRCQPPWKPHEIKHKVEDAFKSTRVPRGYLLSSPSAAEAGPANIAPGDTAPAIIRRRRSLTHRIPTGIPTLDSFTGGGIPLGRSMVIGAPPGAGKTALLIQILVHIARSGNAVCVGMFADEGRDAAAVRIGQHYGLGRDELEIGSEEAARRLEEEMDEGVIILPDTDRQENTIEAVMAAMRAVADGKAIVLAIDSLQTVRTGRSNGRSQDLRVAMKEIIAAIQDEKSRLDCVVIAISQVARGLYRAKKEEDKSNPLASFLESSSIEYGFDVVGTVTGDPEKKLSLVLAKNRLGRKGTVHLRLEAETAQVHEIEAEHEEARTPAVKPPKVNERAEYRRRTEEAVALVLRQSPDGLSGKEIETVCHLGRRMVADVLGSLNAHGSITRAVIMRKDKQGHMQPVDVWKWTA